MGSEYEIFAGGQYVIGGGRGFAIQVHECLTRLEQRLGADAYQSRLEPGLAPLLIFCPGEWSDVERLTVSEFRTALSAARRVFAGDEAPAEPPAPHSPDLALLDRILTALAPFDPSLPLSAEAAENGATGMTYWP